MKPTLPVLAIACLVAPAIAQQGDTEIEHEGRALINQWVSAFNRGDADALAALQAAPDTATLATTIANLRADSFGKLDVYSADFCGMDSTHGRALLKYARIYTFGGKMNDDEARLLDIEKIAAGWRITNETDASYNTVLSCN